MSSLDISRSNLAVHGSEIFDFVIDLVDYARQEINNIGDYYAYADEKINGDSVFDFDTTKLAIYTLPVVLLVLKYMIYCVMNTIFKQNLAISVIYLLMYQLVIEPKTLNA